jgi:nitronate monooxygenase
LSFRSLLQALPIPIIQSPMLGASLDALAVEVTRAGGLGTLAAGSLAPQEIGPTIGAVRERVAGRPFAVNLLIAPKGRAEPGEVDAALERLRPWYDALGAPLPAPPNQFAPDFDAQLAALVEAAPPVASFTFDVLTKDQVQALRRVGTYVVGTANTVAEARAWAEAGADGICAQGSEAGGHRGNFLADVEASLVGTMALVATVRDAVDLPVIAAGGIMDGRGVAAALALGAEAAQIGTAFLLADEAVTPQPWRRAVEQAPDDPTRLTRAFSGRWARGIENRFMRDMRAAEREVPAYPVQNRLTQPLRTASSAADDPEAMSLWAGQAAKLARPGAAGEMVRRWWTEAQDAAKGVVARAGEGRG